MGSKPKGISASRGAAVLGLSKWATPVDIWLQIQEELEPGFCEINNYEMPTRQESAPLRWGLAFEDAICDLAEQSSGLKIRDREKEYSIENGLITCHIDGAYYIFDHKDNGKYEQKIMALHEGKTTTLWSYRDDWGEPGTDQIPRQYMIQVQHQMMCSGIDKCIVSVLILPMRQDEFENNKIVPKLNELKTEWNLVYNGGCLWDGGNLFSTNAWAEIFSQMGLFKQYTIHADLELHEVMLSMYKNWWEQYVVTKKPPQPSTYSDIKKLIRSPSGTIVANAKIERLSSEYKSINEELSAMAHRKEQIKTEILNLMNAEIKAQDEESAQKWILRSQNGIKLHSYDGKRFR